MECSSATLWADHRLAVIQKYSLMPKIRHPYSFLLFSLISFPVSFFSVAPDSSWPVSLFGVLPFLAMPVIAAMIYKKTDTSSCRKGPRDPGRERLTG